MLKNEKIIEIKVCKHCNSEFEITDKDLEFYEKMSPVFPQNGELSSKNGEIRKLIKPLSSEFSALNSFKYLIPIPNLCPDCRQQRRLSFRNERNLYKRKCDFSGKDIISIYSPDKKVKVYDQEIWWSDKWDGLDYGINYDFNQTFFKQFGDLSKSVPKLSIMNKNSEKSEFTNFSINSKNCYLIISSANNEDCSYGVRAYNSFDVYDFIFSFDCNNCYEVINSSNCYKCFFIIDSENCENSYYLNNCKNCSNCFSCSNLIDKQYYINNKKYSKEEYFEYLKKINYKGQIPKLSFYKNLDIIDSENCLGNYIQNSNDIYYGFNIKGCENCRYIYDGTDSNNCENCDYLLGGILCYELLSGVQISKSLFSNICWESDNVYYSDNCFNSSNIFGCVGLKNKSYCILNKQYTKEEYGKLVPKIIEHMIKTGEWGEFFPSSLSPFGYNETVAEEYFPLSRSDVIPANAGIYSKEKLIKGNNDSEILKSNSSKEDSKNFRELIDSGSSQEGQTPTFLHGPIFNWSTYESPKPKVDKIIPASKLPENIKEIPDDILNWAIMPEDVSNDSNHSLQKPFRIIKEELEFYRKHNLPIPKRHPDQRHADRNGLRNPRKLYDRLCDCEKCEENSKKVGTFKQEEFALKDSELNSEGQRRKIKTTYSPNRKEIVYCEECYNKEVY